MANKIGFSDLKVPAAVGLQPAGAVDVICATNLPATQAVGSPTIATAIGINEAIDDFTAVVNGGNGLISVFTLSHTPTTRSIVTRSLATMPDNFASTATAQPAVDVFYNGLRLRTGASNDYTIVGATLSMIVAPAAAATSFYVKYRY